MNDNLSKVYAKSAKSEQDYREYPEVLREAVSIARRMQVIFLKFLFWNLFLGYAALWEASTDIKGQKISKANHGVLNSPKKERCDNFHYIKLPQRSFFWENWGHHKLLWRFTDLYLLLLSISYISSFQSIWKTILASGCRLAVVWQSSGSRLAVIGAVVRQSSGSRLAVILQSSGSRLRAVWQSSESRQAVVWQSSGSRLAVVWLVWQLSGNRRQSSSIRLAVVSFG
jgi:hypothetical protein